MSAVTNPEARQRMLDAARAEAREEQRARAESAGTKAWLERRLDEQARTVPVMGRDFEFRPIGTDTVADILEQVENEDLSLSQMPGLLRKVRDLLAESCLDDEFDREAWGKVPPDVSQRVFEDVAFPEEELSEEDRERVERFLDE